jgi:RNA polymerase sigma-70 factor (ECF subfamily)
VKLGTVRSRIHRGRQALREYLANHPEAFAEGAAGSA